uniref:Uncharacterized protein n=1 Tax=Anguilla anguilla TaxID=7936 RepID=A0A0E9T6R3_ANGAN
MYAYTHTPTQQTHTTHSKTRNTHTLVHVHKAHMHALARVLTFRTF